MRDAERRLLDERAAHQRTLWQLAGAAAAVFVWEMQRRLGELNHENERILANQRTHVSQEKFDGFVEGQQQREASVAKALTLAEGGDRARERRRGYVQPWQLWVASAAVSLVVLVASGRLG